MAGIGTVRLGWVRHGMANLILSPVEAMGPRICRLCGYRWALGSKEVNWSHQAGGVWLCGLCFFARWDGQPLRDTSTPEPF